MHGGIGGCQAWRGIIDCGQDYGLEHQTTKNLGLESGILLFIYLPISYACMLMKKPPDDRDVKVCILKNMLGLSIFLEQFKKAVALFELLERSDPPVGVLENELFTYRMIAARDGALSIFHFKCSLEAIKKQLPRCRSIAAKVDAVKIRDSVKQFSAFFPHTDNVRHAIAHAGERFSSPERMKEHSMKVARYGPGFAIDEGGYLLSALHERTYSVGNLGEIFSVRLDQTAISNLQAVISSVQQAFQAYFEARDQPREN